MHNIARKIGRITFSKDKLRKLRLRYINQLHKSIMVLYDLNFVSRIDCFMADEAYKCLLDEHKDIIMTYCYDAVVGDVRMNQYSARVASKVLINEDKDCSKALSAYADAYEAEQMLAVFSELERKERVPVKGSDTFTLKYDISVSNGTPSVQKFLIDYDCLSEAVYKPEGKMINRISLNLIRLIAFLKNNGVVGIDLHKSYILGDGFTFNDDAEYLLPLLRGDVGCKGEFSDTLAKLREDFMTGNTWSTAHSFDWQVMSSVNTYLSGELDKYKDYDFCYLTSNYAYYMSDCGTGEEYIPREFYIGSFMSGTDDPVARLHGVGGTVERSKSVLNACGYRESDNTDIVYSEDYVVSSDFVDRVLREHYDVGIEEISGFMAKYYNNELVGILVQALICCECDYVLKGHFLPSHVLHNCLVTQREYDAICETAADAYIKLRKRWVNK